MEVSMDKLKKDTAVELSGQHLGGKMVSQIEQYLDSSWEYSMDSTMD